MPLHRTALACALATGLLFIGSTAWAKPPFLATFKKTYNVKKDTTLDKAGCTICHMPKKITWNPYGLDVRKALKQAKAAMLTPAILKKVEQLDSDKDGVKNLDEIKADALPGDPKSKPAPKPVKPMPKIAHPADAAKK